MRRPLVTVVTTIAAVLTIAGCSADPDSGASAPATSAPAGGADGHSGHGIVTPGPDDGATRPARPASGNAEKVCAEALKTSSSSAQVYVAELGRMLQATGVQDAAAAQEAERRAGAAITDWSAAMRAQSAQATDPQLKALLAEIATEVGTMRADIASIEATTLEDLQRRLDELCES